ncbi:hypothetical protein TSUD_370600 [Trifolium subterraneum]|uniref:Major facilitator superfamily (MFS) profile domain-containing protein n=1 Tax=Trifolium subterraneum TaxID=3900 RepID=A0A2Z6MI70_TRISU|nr:hypothetical protein TSUD_370600 [Trifolium subterraneum]
MGRESSIPMLKKKLLDEESLLVESNSRTHQRKPGWKAMPFILGNDTVERLANFGMQTNFIVYLMKVYNMDQVLAANIMNTWMAVSNVVPLIGAFVADSYFGKFHTIGISSFASLIGLVILMLTAWVPQLHPTPCSIQQQPVFYAGTRVYFYVKPEGSILSSIAQVLVAARHKNHLHLAASEDTEGAFYDPTFLNDSDEKLPLTKEFRCLNKAALVVEENELNCDGLSKDPWRLCSIQQIEELKCMLKIIPIWVTSIIVFIPVGQLSIFSISQALKMDRHIKNFEIHPGSVSVITLVAISVFLPFYDSVISPLLEKITKQEQGLTTLQRIGLGHGSAILSVVVAGLVEKRRRELAISMGDSTGVAPMSVMWLAPQFLLIAFCHIFGTVGYTEFFNKESPNSMRSISNSLLCLNISAGSNLSTFIVNIVHSYTGKQGEADWLDSDINKGRLEYFYFIIAGLVISLQGQFIERMKMVGKNGGIA